MASPERGATTCVFFYGLNMDPAVLAQRGVHGVRPLPAWVDGHAVVLRAKAILLARPGARAYGALAALTARELDALYAGLAGYVPVMLRARRFDPAHPAHPAPRAGAALPALAMVHVAPDLAAPVDADYLARWRAIAAALGLPAAQDGIAVGSAA